MATAYTSTRYPVGFKSSLYTNTQDGSLAVASTVHGLAENQHWLGMGDLDVVNFHQSFGSNTLEWNNSTKEIKVMVPPFCQFAGFHFYVSRDFDLATPTVPAANGVTVTSKAGGFPYDIRTYHNVEFGEDLTALGKTIANSDSYGWVHIEGVVDNPQTDDNSALKLAAATSEAWSYVNVSIIMGAKVYCRAAAYHLIPNTSGYIVVA